MKMFGEYLVEQNIISEHDLLEALIIQLSETPTLAEACFACKLIEVPILLKILKLQAIENTSFPAACQGLGIDIKELQAKTDGYIKKKRRLIGQILVSTGKLNNQTLLQEFDAYKAQLNQDKKAPKKTDTLDQNKQKHVFSLNNKNFLNELYFDTYSEELHQEIKHCLTGEPENFCEHKKQLRRKLFNISSAACFIDAKQSQTLSGLMCSTVEHLCAHDCSNHECIKEMSEILLDSINLLWKIRSELFTSGKENPEKDCDLTKDYQKTIKELEAFLTSIKETYTKEAS